MFKSIFKYFRALGYLLTGRVDAARKTLMHNPAVIKATFDDIISTKANNLLQHREVLKALMVDEEKLEAKCKGLEEKVKKYTKERDGAYAVMQKLAAKHGTKEAAQADPEFVAASGFYKDRKSSLAQYVENLEEAQAQLKEKRKVVATHKSNGKQMLRELDKAKEKKSETVAAVISAKEMERTRNMMEGLASDKTDEQMQEMDQILAEAKASQKLSTEVTMSAEAEAEEYAKFADDFLVDEDIDGLFASSEEEKPANDSPVQIPE